MALRRYRGGSQAPPGLYLETWLASPLCIRRGDPPLPGPADRRFLRLSPLAAILLAPFLGTAFVLGFLFLTPAAILLMPIVALKRRSGRGGPGPGALGLLAGGILGSAVLLGGAQADAQSFSNETCLGCHRNPGLTIRLGDGTAVSLQVSPEAFAKSIHSRSLLCTACHRDIQKIPHRPSSFANRRALVQHYSRACTACHSGKFQQFQESVHWRLLAAGDQRAPFCADCHSAHAVPKGGLERGQVSHACAQCHGGIYGLYEKSVHGKALLGEENPDVPTCSTCHRSHTIQDPRTVSFRIDIPRLCAECHEDGSRMARYGISTRVISTYLQDFHGMTVGLYRRQASPPLRLTAVCTDCHGIHEIRRVEDPESRVVKANLLRTCQGCHPGAPPDFPAAWLAHYIPSPRRAPLVYYTKLFYLIFIPGVVGTIVLHVGLDLFREIRHRRDKARSREGRTEEGR